MQTGSVRRRKMTNGDEYDAYTRWRRVLHWQSGERASIKRRTHKRERREWKPHYARDKATYDVSSSQGRECA